MIATKSGEVFKMVTAEHQFVFRNLCPYCGGYLTYRAEGWIKDENGLWKADGPYEMQCSSEPELGSDDWDDWFAIHSDMPYVHQLPVDKKVQDYINQRFRFILD